MWILATLIGLVAVLIFLLLPQKFGVGSPSKKFTDLISKSPEINKISFARIFLFGARDIWFVVALPVFLYANHWDFWAVGAVLAIWTIFLWVYSRRAPYIMRVFFQKQQSVERKCTKLVYIARINSNSHFVFDDDTTGCRNIINRADIFWVFLRNKFFTSFFFNCRICWRKKAAEDIGFYYSANASGRLVGTLLSGFLYQYGGLLTCLGVTAIFLLISSLIVFNLENLDR